jgi:hypothetical protein
MMPTLPFLYLPDAVTLSLLIIVFSALRRAAVDHAAQELLSLREEMLVFWIRNGLNPDDEGYIALSNILESATNLLPSLSPGRLIFIHRLTGKMAKRNIETQLPDPSRNVDCLIEGTTPATAQQKLKRLHLETNLALGTFMLAGSLSGCALTFIIASRMLRRTVAHHGMDRTDFFFDLLERVLGILGRQALQIGSLTRR